MFLYLGEVFRSYCVCVMSCLFIGQVFILFSFFNFQFSFCFILVSDSPLITDPLPSHVCFLALPQPNVFPLCFISPATLPMCHSETC